MQAFIPGASPPDVNNPILFNAITTLFEIQNYIDIFVGCQP